MKCAKTLSCRLCSVQVYCQVKKPNYRVIWVELQLKIKQGLGVVTLHSYTPWSSPPCFEICKISEWDHFQGEGL